MYTDRFVEELLKTVQNLAEENREQGVRLKELESEIKNLRGEPVLAIARNLPSYPADKEDQKNWWALVQDLLYAIDGELPKDRSEIERRAAKSADAVEKAINRKRQKKQATT